MFKKLPFFLILTVSSFLFIPFIGQFHLLDWDEINFAESAREMLVSGDYADVQIAYHTFWEKPPLFIWFQVLSMKIFGVNEFAARFPNALCGIISALTLFFMLRKWKGERFALMSVLAFVGSVLPFVYFKSGIIDPWFNYFIIMGHIFFWKYYQQEIFLYRNLILSGAFIGAAILTKGPVALLLFALSSFVLWIYDKPRKKISFSHISLFFLPLLFVGGFWFIVQILKGNFSIVSDFIVYQIRLFKTQDAGHGGFFAYHPVVLLVGMFPAVVFALGALKKSFFKAKPNFEHYMFFLLISVLCVFSIVQTKIIHYSSLAYFPVAYLAATYLDQLEKEKGRIKFFQTFSALIWLLIPCILVFFAINKEQYATAEYIKDPFAVANLQADVAWSVWDLWVILPLLLGLTYYIFSGKNLYNRALVLFIANLFFVYSALVIYVPRVERYTQNAAIEFFESLKGKDVYIASWRYKTYAKYYYGAVNPSQCKFGLNDDEILAQVENDKDIYVSMKIQQKEDFNKYYPDYIYLYEKNGFVFFYKPKAVSL